MHNLFRWQGVCVVVVGRDGGEGAGKGCGWGVMLVSPV